MKTSESTIEFDKAFTKAQSAFPPIKRSEKVDFVTKSGARIKYSYTPLDELLNTFRPILNANGIGLLQPTRTEGDRQFVETNLRLNGEWVAGEMSILPSDHNPQSEGSALSYSRRYGLASLLGIASEEDDDARAAMVRQSKPKEQPKPTTTPKPETDEEDANYKAFWTHCGSELGLNSTEVHDLLGVKSVKDDLVAKGITLRQVYNMVVEKMKAPGNPSLEL